MRIDTLISCRYLSHYTIYFIILGGRDAELYNGKKVYLSDPEDEDFTARAVNQKIRFDDINYLYFNIPILQSNNDIYDAKNWWELLEKNEKRNMQNIYASGFTDKNEKYSERIIKYIYRELLIDQFKKGVIKIPKFKIQLNWWKLLPHKTLNQIFSKNSDMDFISYNFEDLKRLYELHYNEFNNETMSTLLWWFKLTETDKLNNITKYMGSYLHITAPSIDDIKMMHQNA